MHIVMRFQALFQERVDHGGFTESLHYVLPILTLCGTTGTPFPLDSYFPADTLSGTSRSPLSFFIGPASYGSL